MSIHRYFTYLRKSSESEERQELSIPAQAEELRVLAERRQLRVVGRPFEESRSAKEPGRPVFDDVVRRVCRGEADGILCWKLDRLARNPLDGGRIMHSLGKGLIKEIITPERTYTGTGDDKLLMSIIFGMATKYSDDLSDNVRRGNREALRSGRWPGKPKLGYARDHASMRLVPDKARFGIVRELWEMLLAGKRPLDILRAARADLGLRTPIIGRCGGKLLSKSALYRMFRDPFYCGLMVRKRETYPGSHPPMVTRAEFDQAQDMLDGSLRPKAKPQHLFFLFGGLIRCGRCGAAVTAKHATNRYGATYTYYYCCRKERRYGYCAECAVQESEIERQLSAILARVVPPREWCSELVEHLRSLQSDQSARGVQVREQLERSRGERELQLERERDLLVRGLITEDEYLQDRGRLLAELQSARERLAGLDHPLPLVEPHMEALKRLRQAAIMFKVGTPTEKRTILEALTWNLQLRSKELRVQLKKPFSYLGEWQTFPSVSG